MYDHLVAYFENMHLPQWAILFLLQIYASLHVRLIFIVSCDIAGLGPATLQVHAPWSDGSRNGHRNRGQIWPHLGAGNVEL